MAFIFVHNLIIILPIQTKDPTTIKHLIRLDKSSTTIAEWFLYNSFNYPQIPALNPNKGNDSAEWYLKGAPSVNRSTRPKIPSPLFPFHTGSWSRDDSSYEEREGRHRQGCCAVAFTQKTRSHKTTVTFNTLLAHNSRKKRPHIISNPSTFIIGLPPVD